MLFNVPIPATWYVSRRDIVNGVRQLIVRSNGERKLGDYEIDERFNLGAPVFLGSLRFRHVRLTPGIVCVSFFLLFLRFNAFASAVRDDALLPPSSADRSPGVAQIRNSLTTGDLALAQQLAEHLIAVEPKNYEGYFWLGFVYLRLDEGYDAVRFLRRAEALDANPYVLKLLSLSYYTIRQFRLFVTMMNEAIAKQSDDYLPYYYLGRYYLEEVTDYDKARQDFLDAIERNPDHFQSHFYIGYCHELKREVVKAEAQYQVSIDLSRVAGASFASPYQGMARLRLLEDRPVDALTFATKAVELAPKDPTSHQVLAKTYTALSRQNDAISEWEKTANLDPTFAVPYYQLYRIYVARGNQDKAISALEQFKNLSSIY
jgi:tetratricopeptide (TPR) repeat protein